MVSAALLEDIAAEIGFTATVRLSAAYSRRNIYVPATITPAHPLAALLGNDAAARLSKAFGNEILYVAGLDDFDRWRMVRAAAEMAARGIPRAEIARALMVSVPHCRKLLEEAALIGAIKGAHAATTAAGEQQMHLLEEQPAQGKAPTAAKRSKTALARAG